MSLYNKDTIRNWFEKWGLVAVMLLILSSFTVSSQDDRRSRRLKRDSDKEAIAADSSAPELTDSMIAARDSIARADSIHRADSISMLAKVHLMFLHLQLQRTRLWRTSATASRRYITTEMYQFHMET